nr:histone acetyltransferase HAC1-like isoform X3 [Tanacetum cinerariifolium]
MHTCQSGETNLFSEVAMNNATLDTTDKDDVFVNSFFETRDAFLNMSIANPELMKIVEEGLVASVCGSNLKYTDDGEMEQEKNFKYNTTGKEVIERDLYEFQVTTGGATSETASKAAFDAGDIAARYCFIYSRLCLPSKEIVGGSKSEQLHKQKSLALNAVLDTLMQPKEQTKALYSSAVILYTSPGEIALCGLT